MRLPTLLAALILPVLARPVSADVIVVDPAGGGDFITLSAAVTAAAEGDTVLISPSAPCTGCVGGAVVDGKSLTIAFDAAAGSAAAYPLNGLQVNNLAAGQLVVLRGLHVDHTLYATFNDGTVWIEDCTATGKKGSGDAPGGCLTPEGVGDGLPGIYAWFSFDVIVIGCTLTGGPGADAFLNQQFPSLSKLATDGGSGLFAAAATVVVHGSTLTAGKGGSGQLCFELGDGGPGLDAVKAGPSSHVFLSGCTLLGGEPGAGPAAGAPGPGLRGDATSTFEIMDSSVLAWPGGADFVTAPGAVIDYPETARRFSLPSPLREGDAATLSIAGEMGDFVGFFWSFNGLLTPKPGKSGWFLLGGPFIAGPSLIGAITDPGGEWLIPITTPLLPAAVEEQTFLLQAYFQHAGGATLGSGTAFTLLDASL